MSDYNDGLVRLAGDAGALLKKRGETIAVARSSSGGVVSASLLSVPGASSYFLGGGTIYTRVARRCTVRTSPRSCNHARFDRGLCPDCCRGSAEKNWGRRGVCARVERAGLPEILMVMRQVTSRLRSPARGQSRAPWKLALPTGEGNMWRFAGEALNLLQEGGALTLEPTLQRTRYF